MGLVLDISSTKQKKKILFLSPYTPDPKGIGAEQRAFSFLNTYSKFAEIDLWFQPTPTKPELNRLAAAYKICNAITPCFFPQIIHNPIISKNWHQQVALADAVHITSNTPVYSQTSHKNLLWDLDGSPSYYKASRKKVLDVPDDLAAIEKNIKNISKNMAHSRFVFSSTKVGTELFDQPFAVVNNCIESPEASSEPCRDHIPRLLFVGNFNYPPNAEALLYFHDNIFPLLTAALPHLRIDVVGRAPIKDQALSCVKVLEEAKKYDLHFDVPDCASFYRKAHVAIAPIISGDGTRIKIIEAFAHKCPVVSTVMGCEGLQVSHNRDLLVAFSPQDFSLSCQNLLNAPDLSQRLAENAFRYFEENHTQDYMDRLLATKVGRLL